LSNPTAQIRSNGHRPSGSVAATPSQTDIHALTFWRVEGSLAALGAVRPVAYFTWNSHTFAGRWARRGGALALALVRPFLYASNRVFATRVLHTLLAGVTRDRLDSLGEEYFEYVLKKQLKAEGVERLRACVAEKGTENVVLVSQGLDHVMRPLAQYLGVSRLVCTASNSAMELPRADCGSPSFARAARSLVPSNAAPTGASRRIAC
jgi:hypothetical protein